MRFNAIYEEVEQLYLPGFEKPNPTYLKIGPVETYHPSEPYSKATWLIVTFEKIDAKTKEVLEKHRYIIDKRGLKIIDAMQRRKDNMYKIKNFVNKNYKEME